VLAGAAAFVGRSLIFLSCFAACHGCGLKRR